MDGYILIYFVECAVPTLLWVFRKIHIGGSVFALTWKIIAIRLCIALLGSLITIYFLIRVCMRKLAIDGFFTAAILLIIIFGLNFLLFAETRKVVLQNSTADNLPYMEEKLKKEKFGLQLAAAIWGYLFLLRRWGYYCPGNGKRKNWCLY